MSDYIKQSDIPAEALLAEALGFDADGNWAKMAPADPARVQAAQTTANTAKTTAETAKTTANTAKTTAETAKTTANTAKTTAETFADGTTPGRVKPAVLQGQYGNYPVITSLAGIFGDGALQFSQGRGVPAARFVNSLAFHTLANDSGAAFPIGVPLLFSGAMTTVKEDSVTGFDYTGGYAKRQLNGIGFIAGGLIVIFDIQYGEIWCAIMSSPSDFVWKMAGGGSDYTLPAASATRLGGIKTGAGLTTHPDGTTGIADSANLPGSPTSPITSSPATPLIANLDLLATHRTLCNHFMLCDIHAPSAGGNTQPSRYTFINETGSSIYVYFAPINAGTYITQEQAVYFTAGSPSVRLIFRLTGSTSQVGGITLTGLTVNTYYRADVTFGFTDSRFFTCRITPCIYA